MAQSVLAKDGSSVLCLNASIWGRLMMLQLHSTTKMKQDIVAMSTLEAEHIACLEAARESRWLLQLCKDIEHKDENKPLPILCDNEGTLSHITNTVVKSRKKHIDHWEDRSTRSSRKPWAYGWRHWSRNLYSCIWIFYVNGMAVPYQATDCTLSLPTAANWRRVLMRHRRFHFMMSGMMFSTIFV